MYIFFVFEKAQQSELSAQFHCELKTTLKNKVHLKEKKKKKQKHNMASLVWAGHLKSGLSRSQSIRGPAERPSRITNEAVLLREVSVSYSL